MLRTCRGFKIRQVEVMSDLDEHREVPDGERFMPQGSNDPLVGYQGVYIPIKLREFVKEVKSAFRGIEVGVLSQATVNAAYEGSIKKGYIARELDVYYPNDQYSVATISYRNVTVTRGANAQFKYAVSSPFISNERYDTYREEHKMRASSNLNTAVRDAKKFIRRIGPAELVEMTVEEVVGKFTQREYKSNREMHDTKTTLVRNILPLLQSYEELCRKYDEPMPHPIDDQIREFRAAEAEYGEILGTVVKGACIQVEQRPIGTVYNIIHLKDLSSKPTHYDIREIQEGRHSELSKREHEVSEAIRGKVAVLMMVPIDQFVEGVGMRVDSTVCYVDLSDEPE